MVNEYFKQRQQKIPVHIKIDTGMSRLGFNFEQFKWFCENLRNLRSLEIHGVFSHYSHADHTDPSFCERQMIKFKECLAVLPPSISKRIQYHIANSAATVRGFTGFPNALIRPGLLLYGVNPIDDNIILDTLYDLRPVMTVKSSVLAIRELSSDVTISYNGTFKTNASKRIATIPIGYHDGLFRLLSNRGHVLIHGKRAPIVGNITMDLTMIDVTHIPEIQLYDEVIVLGSCDNDTITAQEMANHSHTISYEILSTFGRRVPLIFHE